MKLWALFFSLLVAPQFAAYGQKLDSSCSPTSTSAPAAWGGKEVNAVDLREHPMKKLEGIMMWPGDEPADGVFLQVFKRAHTDPLFTPPDQDSRKPIAACVTNAEGDFSFSLPHGEYEMRASFNRGVTATSVFVIVGRGRTTRIAVPIREGE
jgi:hypothetical protein